ncbi:MAG: DNA-directed RNA polymerase subunit beta [Puniceicoccales bacterium]|jgi:DNA-directed RNA polymerase subunit beta|nr:DNA-directed RNA polymerase subunit beta [Puniceicoccales bacterium]
MTENNRVSFGKLKEVITPPYLIEAQINSFKEFLQADVDPMERQDVGLESVFKRAFPIESYDGSVSLDYVSYRVARAKYGEGFCLKEGRTCGSPLYLRLRLSSGDDAREEEIYIGEIPIMSERGSFIISGAERVVVSQLHRSPGICFEVTPHATGKMLYTFRIMPDRGTWIEVQNDQNDLLYVYLDRRRRRRRFLLTTLLRAFGYSSDREILSIFYKIRESSVEDLMGEDSLMDVVLTDDVIDVAHGVVLARAYEPLGKGMLKSFAEAGIRTISVVNVSEDGGLIIRSLKKDTSRNEEEALFEIYRHFRPGEPLNIQNARTFFIRNFKDGKRYDLSKIGRYKINSKLGLNKPLNDTLVGPDDIVAATKYLCLLRSGEGFIDDIDNLGSRRIRGVGELLINQCRVGLARMERVIREKMSLLDQSVDMLSPQKLVNGKLLMSVIRDFFARSQLSQFMDQINPLSELTHKRRLSALGPSGLNRDRAGMEVRDVHSSHYGRICPIETPEGPNIGLINSLSTYSRINDFGFIETPYRIVKNGRVMDDVVYLSADKEEGKLIAQANSDIDEHGNLVGKVTVRKADEVLEIDPKDADFMDVSPKQVISVAAGLIPFLEHDDTSRALMGANMQRQGVPLVITEAPLVGTGIEKKLACDSGHVVLSKFDGIVASVDGNRIVVTEDGKLPEKLDETGNSYENSQTVKVYRLQKYWKSNASTCFNQRPIVRKHQKVKAGDVLADGAATDNGELALGKNVLVAFMPWNGYNFEDAVILNERVIRDDVFTSIHIEEYEVSARDTKLGPEEITRDIPNVGDEALKNLSRSGIIKVGAEVKPGDILVGKITPKTETDLAPEEKLLRAIFGEKAADVKDSSLLAPAGCNGTVMEVKISSRTDNECEDVAESECRRRVKKTNEEFRAQADLVRNDLTEAFSSILLGEKIPLDIIDSETGEVVLPANRKITKTLLRRLAACGEHVEMASSPVKTKIMEIIEVYQAKFDDLEEERVHKVAAIEAGNIDDSGIIKNVKVFIANRRKIQVGDKMAGRHGNKGVVSKIVKSEDMPFLADGTPIDIILNPLGVPSRMNVGQVLETHLGWVCQKLGIKVATPVFDGASEERITKLYTDAGLPDDGKVNLFDGCTGRKFDQKVMVGYIYMMKLNHLVADKVHARAVGPYSLITQQPLGGRAQYGGQRLGEMEVWALEAYGAAYALQEFLTVKSDDSQGRTKIYESIVKGDTSLDAGIPQSFNVLIKEMQGLCLDVKLDDDRLLDMDGF